MRILLTLHCTLDPNSGAPGTTLHLAKQYRRRGHEVDVLGFDDLLPEWIPQQGKMVAFPWAIACRLARARYDVIDASTGDAWLVGTLRRVFPAGVRRALLVTRSHGLEHTADERCRANAEAGGESLSWKYPLYHGGYRLWEVERSLRAADVALFLKTADATFAVEQLGVAHRHTRVVRNGISDALIGLPAPTSSRGKGRIAVIGSYLPMKGIAQAAAALNAWLPRHDEWTVSFLGTGVSEAVVLADYAPGLHPRISVESRYENDDLPHLLAGHQIHLFPTLSEGGPLALVEAMACGLAPVASDIPGVADRLKTEQDAILVRPADPDAIVSALDRLVADRPLLERLRSQAHRAAQSYGWSVVAGEQLDIYEEHLAHRHPKDAVR